jgi:peptidoglycan/xylan/chitin deacetylase (PgdA/CDA1 family)
LFTEKFFEMILRQPTFVTTILSKMKNLIPVLAAVVVLASCSGHTAENNSEATVETKNTIVKKDSSDTKATPTGPVADAATIMARTQVPVLCYHHIVAGKPKNAYEVTIDNFKQQMQALADSGYHTILPEQYYNYLAYGTPLPEKPVMLTYDDTDEEQFSIAKPEMDKHGFKGVYFIMTISIGRPRYMSKEQIKQLADEGHVIGSHTWRHDRVDRLKDSNTIEYRGKKIVVNEWDFQLTNTKNQLEEMTGKPVEYFAFPFGIWSKNALPEIEKRGYKMAFQLSEKRDPEQPLYTARRIIVAPSWSGSGLIKAMKNSFQ